MVSNNISKSIVWSIPLCSECQIIKKNLKNRGIDYEEKNMKELLEGEGDFYPKAVRQMVNQNFMAPIVIIDGEVKNKEELL